MKIAYNPESANALTAAPSNNDITFDLAGKAIYAKGVKFEGMNTTYSVFKKHTSDNSGGYDGLVPVPSYTTTTTRYLREDGTWVVPTNYYRPISVNGTSILENNNTALDLVAGANISITAENSSGYTGKVIITNTGVRSTTINGNCLRVDTNGTNADLTIPYATTAGSANSVAWGNITGKPSSYTPSAHNHSYIKGGDNRNVNNDPSWYMTNPKSASVYTEFSLSGGAVSGTYENRTTFTPWVNNTGQRPVQLAFNNSGVFMRTSKSDTEWNSWYTVYHSGNLTKSTIGLGNVQNTAFYQRLTIVNGTVWDMAGTNSNATFIIYAPTTAGTSGQVLTSTAGTPGWTNLSSLSVGNAGALGGYALSSFMTFGNNGGSYVNASFNNSDLSQLAVDKYIEFWDSPGWFNSQWGKVTAHGGFVGNLTGTASYATSAGSATKATQDSDGNTINATYLKLSGGTMTGAITTPGNDTVVIKPKYNNYDQIGGEGQAFWKIWATNFYGSLHGNADSATYATSAGSARQVTCTEASGDTPRPIVGIVNNLLYYTSKVTIRWDNGNVTAPTFTGRLIGSADKVNGYQIVVTNKVPTSVTTKQLIFVY